LVPILLNRAGILGLELAASGASSVVAMSNKRGNTRRAIGVLFLVTAVLQILWLPLGILEVLPFVLQLPGESPLRSHAGATVASLGIAAWAWWDV
jgi:hypothetical protein